MADVLTKEQRKRICSISGQMIPKLKSGSVRHYGIKVTGTEKLQGTSRKTGYCSDKI